MDPWFHVLGDGVVQYLDDIVARAAGGRVSASDVSGLVSAWRTLLRLHGPAGHHRWRTCRRRRNDPLCTVWQVAIGCFVVCVPEDGRR